MIMSNQQQTQTTSFQGKYGPWAVVTGASSGIGRALAYRLAAAGLHLVLVARRQAVLTAIADELTQRHGITVKVVAVDLAEDSATEIVAQETAGLDVGLLVAAAGFGTSGRFLDGNLAEELNMLQVNCRALLVLSHHFGQRFRQRGRGGLILLSSIVGLQGIPHAAHYGATKAYVQTLAEALHIELAPVGVDVLAAAPGPTNSGFATRAGMKMGQALTPEAVAQPILDALGRKATVLPGFLSKVLVYALVWLPRTWRVRIMGQVMYGMTSHQTADAALLP
jgi:short-subunit dehydrogenase